MGENVAIRSNEFNTKLTAYSTTQHGKDIDVDALIVGAGFGKSLSIIALFSMNTILFSIVPWDYANTDINSRHLHAQDASRPWTQSRHL